MRPAPYAPLAVCLLLCCAPQIKQFYPGTYFPEDRTYQNPSLGFSLTYRGVWDITTEPAQLRDNRSYARDLHDIGAELLYVGFTVEKTQGTRCIVYNKNETAGRYAEEIRGANREQMDDDSGCAQITVDGRQFSTWRYDENGFCFIEYFFTVDTYDVRVAFWSKSKLFDAFRPVYDEIMGSLTLPP